MLMKLYINKHSNSSRKNITYANRLHLLNEYMCEYIHIQINVNVNGFTFYRYC